MTESYLSNETSFKYRYNCRIQSLVWRFKVHL